MTMTMTMRAAIGKKMKRRMYEEPLMEKSNAITCPRLLSHSPVVRHATVPSSSMTPRGT
jgi:hypothetical protein